MSPEQSPREGRMLRTQAAAILSQERQSRRESAKRLQEIVERNPHSRLAKKAAALLLDVKQFDDWVDEAGGDDELLFIICAQVASGVTLKALCRHYQIEYGLLWAWMTEDGARLARYELALRGIADADIAETVELADGATVETVTVDKLGIDTRFKRAAIWDRKRFGQETKANTQINLGANSLVAVLSSMSRVEEAALEAEVVEVDSHAPPVVVGDVGKEDEEE